MNNEIKKILNGVKGGDKVLEYIEELEEHIHHHHHDDNCDCGCHDRDEDEEWQEVKTDYKNTLMVKDWEKLLKNPEIFTVDALKVMKRMRHIAAPTTSAELADMFGLGAMYYKIELEELEERLLSVVKIKNTKEKWAIVFNCWKNKHSDEHIYGLCSELYEALGNIDLSNIPLREYEI